MNKPQLNTDTLLLRTGKLPSAELGPDDVVLLDAEHGVYYGLEGPARYIWDCLESETTLAAICDVLMEKYDVDRQQCERETKEYILQLLENRLVAIR